MRTNIITAICQQCSASFEHRIYDVGKFCSTDCKKAAQRKPKVPRQCLNCGVQFETFPSYAAKGRDKCCSRKCRYEYGGGPAAGRFWAKVDKTGTCWIWTGANGHLGYGQFVFGETRLAHRVAWILTNGSIPDGLFVCHSCDNPPCVRPDHLFLGTHTDNMRDMSSKGRSGSFNHPERLPHGERQHLAKLTDVKVLEMRQRHADGEPINAFYREYGVSYAAAYWATVGGTWKHL